MIFVILICIHLLAPLFYYLYLSHFSRQAWKVKIDQNYNPKVTMIIPTYNESSVIMRKLQNLKKIDYPNEKLEIIIVDSASTDKTANIAKNYLKNNEFPFEIEILIERERRGKANALNFALEHAKNEIIATSDADSYWEPSALRKAICYLADPKVGAVTGREEFINVDQNILTLGESTYRNIYYEMRLGESKLHSTQIFQGELSIYKRWVFEKFNDKNGSDDCGTVVNIISNGYRTIFVPEAIFYDLAPSEIKDRIYLKKRRALHVIHALSRANRLKIENKFPQPSRILYANFFIHIINPFLILPLILGIIYLFYKFPLFLLVSILFFISKKFRILFISYLTSNLALIMAVFGYFKGGKEIVWKKIDGMRMPSLQKNDHHFL